ncbi:MAG: hypothetical protein CL398_02760, partial [Acidiferrobacteraceae bacterium]|nr:hypothetical protein [Acidiferrobacteraceae bacterium]
MDIKRINPGQRMSQAVIHSNVVYLAGQVAVDAPGTEVATQTSTILDQIDVLLRESGTDKSNLLYATIWLASMDSFDEMNEVWDAWVSTDNTPARACVEARLA